MTVMDAIHNSHATYHKLNSWFLHHKDEASTMVRASHIYCEELTKVINKNNRKATCQLVLTFSRESRVCEVEVAAIDGSRHYRTSMLSCHCHMCIIELRLWAIHFTSLSVR
ncbi:hypothetical protein Lal_00043017 [Lupinus albus]|nr:hypothetical protein Lal_00043017 [Lupinus albus]